MKTVFIICSLLATYCVHSPPPTTDTRFTVILLIFFQCSCWYCNVLNAPKYCSFSVGNSLSLARELHDKYRPESRKEFFQLLPKTSTSLTFSSRGKSKAFKQRYQKGLLSMLHSGRDQEFGMSGW